MRTLMVVPRTVILGKVSPKIVNFSASRLVTNKTEKAINLAIATKFLAHIFAQIYRFKIFTHYQDQSLSTYGLDY